MSIKLPNAGMAARPAPEFNRLTPLADQVLFDLRNRIISLELPPNTALSRKELSEFYAISQTPLRDALQKLETEGMLRIFPQSHTLVSPLNLNNIRETQFLRNALEKEIVGLLATQYVGTEILTAEDTISTMELLASRKKLDLEAFNIADKTYHASLFAAAGKRGLFDMIEARSGNLNRVRNLQVKFRQYTKPAHVIEDHRSILLAITEGDAGRARAAIRSHLALVLSRLEELNKKFSNLFE